MNIIRTLTYILLWALSLGISIFATQNTLALSLKFLVWQSINLPLGLVLVFSAGLGAVFATVMQGGPTVKRKFAASKTQPFTAAQPSSRTTDTKKSDAKTTQSPKTTQKKDNKAESDDWDDWEDDW